MTPEEQAYFRMMEDLFAMPGWKKLTEEMKSEIYTLQSNALDLYKSWDEVNVARGRAQQLNELVMLPDILEGIRVQKELEDASSQG